MLNEIRMKWHKHPKIITKYMFSNESDVIILMLENKKKKQLKLIIPLPDYLKIKIKGHISSQNSDNLIQFSPF